MWSYNAPRYGRARAPDYVPDVRDSPAASILALISQSFTRRPVHTVSQENCHLSCFEYVSQKQPILIISVATQNSEKFMCF